jgi:hypothetical protein
MAPPTCARCEMRKRPPPSAKPIDFKAVSVHTPLVFRITTTEDQSDPQLVFAALGAPWVLLVRGYEWCRWGYWPQGLR